MHCSRTEDGVDAYVELGTLIVEGRLPAEGTAKGYKEGPHCPRAAAHLNTHHCDPGHFLCMRAERLRKHMSLMCSNAVPMCVEVLLCPVCQCGTERAQSPEVANIPSSSDLLLEQWIVSVVHSAEVCNMSVRGLFQAVRSQLHFSQLCAWWSNSKGGRPTNVCYRLTLPEEAFASQFSRQPHTHSFPPAAIGPDTQLKVSVRTLPRCDTIPSVQCAACTPETNVRKRSLGLEQPLLGESLLDPPGPSSSRPHGNLCNWHTGSPPSPLRRRPARPVLARHHAASRHILPLPGPVDDRMQTDCNQHGKHDCRCEEDMEELPNPRNTQTNRINLDLSKKEMEEVFKVLRVKPGDSQNIASPAPGKADLLMSAILRSSHEHPANKPQFHQDITCFNVSTTVTNPDSKTGDSSYYYSKKFTPHIDPIPPDKCMENKNKSLSSPFIELQNVNKNPEKKPDSLCLCKAVDVPTNQISNNPQPYLEKTNAPQEKSNSILCSLVDEFRTKQCFNKVNVTEYKEELDVCLVEDLSHLDLNKKVETCTGREVPTALDKAKFRRSLDSAASMVFHWRTGLPLTSSPAPLRRASHRFDFDSSINSVSSIRSALFDSESGEDTESESSKSPCSPQIDIPIKGEPWPLFYQSQCSALLGSFEESVLNGRLEPVSTVQGFTADLGASGSFCPAHLVLPVTVFFYTLGDNDKVSTPYLAHINLGKKGYVVPRCGTIQVTLLNPLGTVIKMFVVMYNLTDMPNNSHTFLRQRTLYMPTAMSEPRDNSQKYLRYLIHLRFASTKSGRVLLHTDIRMIIFRKSDLDTATGHGVDRAYELRSFTHGPTNPKFSPRK